ncbi:MAG: aspartate-semialdehyde dehydrogenase [Verrucomicrobiota bacterium]
MPHDKQYTVAVVGATGAVGREALHMLEARQFPAREVRALASARSRGSLLPFRGGDLEVQELSAQAFEGVDYAIFSAGATRSKEFAPRAVEAGAVVIDNSSAYRMDPEVPLVIPEVNSGDLKKHRGIIANPNCCAAILATALWPLHAEAGLTRLAVSTYQSASGAGAQAMAELEDQVRQYVAGEAIDAEVFPYQIAFNLFSHNTPVGADGLNVEEAKVIEEMRKLFHAPNLKLSVTCIRVPVLRAHSESVVMEFERPLSEARAREILAASPGIRVIDDREHNHFPMPLEATGQLDVLIGRLREDPVFENGLAAFIAGDQLLKGAAWNAVQIAEELVKLDRLRSDTGATEAANPSLGV